MAERADTIMWPKMADYANGRFDSNFRKRAKDAGISVKQAWICLASKHWDAIISFCRDGKLESEDIRDRIADQINYLMLLAGIVEDESGREGASTEAIGSEASGDN